MKQIDTIILVKDIKKSTEFYESVLNLKILHDWKSMVVFENRLALHQVDLLEPKEVIQKYVTARSQGNIIIYLSTESIINEYSRLSENGIKIIHGIVDLPWQKIFRIWDLDENIIEIGEEKES